MRGTRLITLLLAGCTGLCVSVSRHFFEADLFRAGIQSAISAEDQHERLRMRNTFKTPEEVVSYYCARDASGFVWSGLLEIERKAFTLWDHVPQHDTFLVAKKYDIAPAKNGPSKDTVDVEVRYLLTGVGDGHGTHAPPENSDYRILFRLKKINGQWKIAQPSPLEMAPVVLESKFPVARGNSFDSAPAKTAGRSY